MQSCRSTRRSRPDLYVAVILDGNDTITRTHYVETNNINYKVTLVNPGDAFPDVQYALERARVLPFVGGGCKGQRRAHARLSDTTGHELIRRVT